MKLSTTLRQKFSPAFLRHHTLVGRGFYKVPLVLFRGPDGDVVANATTGQQIPTGNEDYTAMKKACSAPSKS